MHEDRWCERREISAVEYLCRVLRTAFWSWQSAQGGVSSVLVVLRTLLSYSALGGVVASQASQGSEVLSIPNAWYLLFFAVVVFVAAPYSVWRQEKKRAEKAEEGPSPEEQLARIEKQKHETERHRIANRANQVMMSVRRAQKAWTEFEEAPESEKADTYLSAKQSTTLAVQSADERIPELTQRAQQPGTLMVLNSAFTMLKHALRLVPNDDQYNPERDYTTEELRHQLSTAGDMLNEPMTQLAEADDET